MSAKSTNLLTQENASAAEIYQVIALSTGHITEADAKLLEELANSQRATMIMGREYGFFIKLFPEDVESNLRNGYSEALKRIITEAHRAGFQMIELDRDAPAISTLPTFNW